MNILITHISYHASVGIIKQLRKLKDIFIIGTSSITYGYSSGSLLVDKFYLAPQDTSKEAYIDFIKKIIDREGVNCIFTADENDMVMFNSRPDIFRDLIYNANNECIEIFTDKLISTIKVSELNVRVPRIYNITELKKVPTTTQIIIRDRVACCSQGIFLTDSNNLNLIENKLTHERFMQKYIEGKEYTVDVFCDKNGQPKIIVPRERLAIRSGITYKCKIEKNMQLIELCKIIYSHFCIPGFSNIQFIVDKQNIAYFIELNPRIGGTTIATSIASINLPALYLDNLICGNSLKSFDYYMSLVKWNAIVTRYYEEVIYYEK